MSEFWTVVEQNTAIRVPKNLQKILKILGYDDASSIKSITTNDIDFFEEFVKDDIEAYIGVNDNPKDFYHIYYNMKNKFKITNGDRVKLMLVVDFVKDKLASEGGHLFFHQSEETIQPTLIETLCFQNTRASFGNDSFSPHLGRRLSNPKNIAYVPNVCHTPTSKSKSVVIDLTSPLSESLATERKQKQELIEQHCSLDKSVIDEKPVDSADHLIVDEGVIDNKQNVATIGGPEFNKKEVPVCQGCQKCGEHCVCVRSDSKCFSSRSFQCPMFRSALGPYKNYPSIHWKKALMLRNKTDNINDTVTTDRRNLRYA